MPHNHKLAFCACIARATAAVFSAFAAAGAQPACVPDGDDLPFCAGEHLEYRVDVSRVRASGRGVMSVEGPVELRGSQTYHLRFDVKAGLGPFKASDRTESWLDPLRMTSLRFRKRERHPLSKAQQDVELYPDEQRWEGQRGAGGESPTDVPLDELSFIYFIRTLPLASDSVYEFDRHFQRDRNPITVRVLRRESVATGLGELAAILVEMRVRDPERYGATDGVIWIHFTDDRRRLPARIESDIPVLGKAILTLQTVTARADRSGKP